MRDESTLLPTSGEIPRGYFRHFYLADNLVYDTCQAAGKKAKDEGDWVLEEGILEMQQARIYAKKRASRNNIPIDPATR